MRRLTSVELMIAVFWVGYAIIAAAALYAAAQPVARVLLLILGGYSIALAPVVIVVLWQAGQIAPRKRTAS
jgi:hypothetical protein